MKQGVFLLLLLLCALASAGAQNPLASAEKLAEEKQFRAASAELRRFIQTQPDRRFDVARAWYLHARNLYELGEWEAAGMANDSSFQQRRALRSGDTAENYLLQAEIELARNDASAALRSIDMALRQLIESSTLYAEILRVQGRAYLLAGDFAAAETAFGNAQVTLSIALGEDAPALAPIWRAGAESALRQGNWASALPKLKEAYRLADSGWLKAMVLLDLWAYQPLLKQELEP